MPAALAASTTRSASSGEADARSMMETWNALASGPAHSSSK